MQKAPTGCIQVRTFGGGPRRSSSERSARLGGARSARPVSTFHIITSVFDFQPPNPPITTPHHGNDGSMQRGNKTRANRADEHRRFGTAAGDVRGQIRDAPMIRQGVAAAARSLRPMRRNGLLRAQGSPRSLSRGRPLAVLTPTTPNVARLHTKYRQKLVPLPGPAGRGPAGRIGR